jgi:pimeloyl-ACP methyl ester carboxylesterase
VKSLFIAYKNSTIHYCVCGNGLKLLFCFHGYGEQAKSFAVLEPTLGKDYTIIAIDMPFHGKTEWKEGLDFTVDDLIAIIDDIVERLNGDGKASSPTFRGRGLEERYSLLGYSMGGRIALQLLQKMPTAIERAVLVAPDGLHKNIWYRFATQTILGKKIFKYVMYQKQERLWFLNVAEKYRLAPAGLLKIVRYYTDTSDQRKALYCRWLVMRKFKPTLSLVKKLVKQYKIPVRFLFGRFDNIILSKRADIFKTDTANVQIHIIDAGHRLLQEKYIPTISALFYQ